MGFHVARFKDGQEARWGVVHGERLFPIAERYGSLGEFLKDGAASARAIAAAAGAGKAGEGTALSGVELLAPITAPCNVVCQGQNYRRHMLEVGQDPDAKKFNQIFRKASSSLTSSKSDIVKPARVRLLDYEIELGIVIGQKISGPMQIQRENLHEVVAGIVICNDISARDIQLAEAQWHKGKSFRTFCPVGPYVYLIDREDVARLMSLKLVLSVNGVVRQSASTEEMVYPPWETLTELSEIMGLEPGDLLLTGTPGGVASGNKMPKGAKWIKRAMNVLMSEEEIAQFITKSQLRNTAYLKDGDVIRATIVSTDGAIDLGTQENRVVDAR